MVRSNQKILLAALVVMWVILLAYRILIHEEPKRAPLTYRPGQTVSSTVAKGKDRLDLVLKLDLLNLKPPPPGKEVKNLFLPLHYEPPKPVSPPPTLPPPPPPPSPEEIAAQKAREELSRFRYLGYLNRTDREQAFLSRGNDLFIVRRGETITGTYQLKEVNNNFAVIQDTATKVEITLALSGG